MNKKSLAVLAVIVLAVIVIWKVSDREEMLDTTNGGAGSVIVALKEQNGSGEMGSVTLSEEGGKTNVVIMLTGAPAGVPQPAHIHMGACPNPTDVKYPLTAVTDGASETTLDVAMSELLSGLPLAVNVHKSADDLSTYVACGDIIGPVGTTRDGE